MPNNLLTTSSSSGLTNLLVLWIVIEPGIYLIAACLPAMHHLFVYLTPASIRNATDRKLAAMRHPKALGSFIHTSNKTLGGGTQSSQESRGGGGMYMGDFTKLGDADAEHTANVTSAPLEKTRHIRPAFLGGHGTRAREMEMEEGGGAGGRDGVLGGIQVTTEIKITQEQRIEDVLGF